MTAPADGVELVVVPWPPRPGGWHPAVERREAELHEIAACPDCSAVPEHVEGDLYRLNHATTCPTYTESLRLHLAQVEAEDREAARRRKLAARRKRGGRRG